MEDYTRRDFVVCCIRKVSADVKVYARRAGCNPHDAQVNGSFVRKYAGRLQPVASRGGGENQIDQRV
jgi:hypothetical protein